MAARCLGGATLTGHPGCLRSRCRLLQPSWALRERHPGHSRSPPHRCWHRCDGPAGGRRHLRFRRARETQGPRHPAKTNCSRGGRERGHGYERQPSPRCHALVGARVGDHRLPFHRRPHVGVGCPLIWVSWPSHLPRRSRWGLLLRATPRRSRRSWPHHPRGSSTYGGRRVGRGGDASSEDPRFHRHLHRPFRQPQAARRSGDRPPRRRRQHRACGPRHHRHRLDPATNAGRHRRPLRGVSGGRAWIQEQRGFLRRGCRRRGGTHRCPAHRPLHRRRAPLNGGRTPSSGWLLLGAVQSVDFWEFGALRGHRNWQTGLRKKKPEECRTVATS